MSAFLPLDPTRLDAALRCSPTKWLQTLLRDDILPAVAAIAPDDTDAFRRLNARIKDLFAQRKLTSLSQQKNPMTQTRGAIKVYFGADHPSLQTLGFTPEEWVEINLPAETALRDRPVQFLRDPDAIVAVAATLLDAARDSDWPELVVGLSAATGRRPAELLVTGRFEQYSRFSLLFSGAVKLGGREDVPFEIPTLLPAADVCDALARVRERVDARGLSNKQVNERFGGAIADACRRHFEGLIPVPLDDSHDDIYGYLCRAVYATIAAHWFCPPHIDPLEFKAHIQGHFTVQSATGTRRRSLASQRNYNRYAIADSSGDNIDGRLGIELDDPTVHILEVFNVPQSYRPSLHATYRRWIEEVFAEADESLADSFDRLIALAQWAYGQAAAWNVTPTPEDLGARVAALEAELDDALDAGRQEQAQRQPAQSAATDTVVFDRLDQVEAQLAALRAQLQTFEAYTDTLDRLAGVFGGPGQDAAAAMATAEAPDVETFEPLSSEEMTGLQKARAVVEAIFVYNNSVARGRMKVFPSSGIVQAVSRSSQTDALQAIRELDDAISRHARSHSLNHTSNRGMSEGQLDSLAAHLWETLPHLRDFLQPPSGENQDAEEPPDDRDLTVRVIRGIIAFNDTVTEPKRCFLPSLNLLRTLCHSSQRLAIATLQDCKDDIDALGFGPAQNRNRSPAELRALRDFLRDSAGVPEAFLKAIQEA